MQNHESKSAPAESDSLLWKIGTIAGFFQTALVAIACVAFALSAIPADLPY